MSELNPLARTIIEQPAGYGAGARNRAGASGGGSLLPIAAVVMFVVFGPALLVWAMGYMRH